MSYKEITHLDSYHIFYTLRNLQVFFPANEEEEITNFLIQLTLCKRAIQHGVTSQRKHKILIFMVIFLVTPK